MIAFYLVFPVLTCLTLVGVAVVINVCGINDIYLSVQLKKIETKEEPFDDIL